MKPVDATLRLLLIIVPCSILCLPASTTVAGYVALRMTQDTLHFDDGAGYARIGLTLLLSGAFDTLGIGICVLLRNRLAIVAAALVALSVPTFKTVNEWLN
ncbi:hypothetical protein PI86_15410 [Burkholderia sp. A9]|uniref:hypothetical protein n=1 Tax=Burkholderia sp. A9 TaxID=1365108 RepID=UPI0005731535|nr:hypothetical protein [Burkholderia sp. A9]KHK49639.1 hypothetical protein PI86_15410 [Burkholderia sp. A9]